MPEIGVIDEDLFCRWPSARLPSTSHAHKMDSCTGIIISAASHTLSNKVSVRDD